MWKEMGPLRVVAADGSPVMRSVLHRMFELHAREADGSRLRMELCELAGDGAEALAAVQRRSLDLLLLDLKMPRLGRAAVVIIAISTGGPSAKEACHGML